MSRRAALALAAVFTFAPIALAQESTPPPESAETADSQAEPKPVPQGDPTTTEKPTLPLDELKLRLKPMQLPAVEVEAKAWVDLLAAKNREISERKIAGNNDNAALTLEQDALVKRVNLVLAAMKDRGGEIETYEKYVNASTGFSLDPADASGFVQYAIQWAISPEGGIALVIQLVKFVLVLIAFRILARFAAGIVRKAVSRMRTTSALLRDFFVTTTSKAIMVIGIVVALSVLGIDVTPFVAAISVVGFIVGFALQGTLSNFAAGIMILIYRPYDVGDVVTVAGKMGKVDAMSLVSTSLRLFDNQVVIIPNGSVWGDVITNATSQTTRRVDMVFGCGYSDDLAKAQRVFEEIITQHPKTLAEPAPTVKVNELGDSSVNFIVRPWTKTEDYWDVFWDVTRQVKDRFDAEGLEIPFPQRSVHLHQAEPA
ncbi:MAG: mechanosensitive ion channel family protein [Planctomycetes bacterium]|nr:mechanosensitive ion channel family protein [Planctomycetota bacterium]